MRRLFLIILFFAVGLGLSADDWPQWRGPERDGISRETGLLQAWPSAGPKRVWLSRDIGLGYSAPVVAKGRLFIMGTEGGKEKLFAKEAKSGKTLWTAALGGVLSNNWGDGPRGAATVDGDRVFALGAKGGLICANAKDGKVHWRVELVKDLGGKVPNWGYTESVLVDGGHVICTPGGKRAVAAVLYTAADDTDTATDGVQLPNGKSVGDVKTAAVPAVGTLAAIDKETGEVIWRSGDWTDGAQYTSVLPAVFNGQRQFVQLTQKTLAGVSARDGSILWRNEWRGRTAVIPTPIIDGKQVYISSGYGAGCRKITVGAGHKVTEDYINRNMKNHHGGVLLLDGHLYGYSDGRGWTCQDFETGEVVWDSKKLGKGCVFYADNRLYCLEESSGTVVLAEAGTSGWKERGRFKIDPQTELRKSSGRIWTHPVVANGVMYLRDQELLFAFDVKAR